MGRFDRCEPAVHRERRDRGAGGGGGPGGRHALHGGDDEGARAYLTEDYLVVAGRGYSRAANQLHSLFIDVNEITDRTENALKIVGDIYAARVFNLAAARLGVSRWKQSVEDKLETLDDVYRFAVEQVAISRGQFLELTVILILVLELVLFFLGIMR